MRRQLKNDPSLEIQLNAKTLCKNLAAQHSFHFPSAATMGGRKKKTKQQKRNEEGHGSQQKQEDILETLEDFTLKENWDKFFTLRGDDDSFEWYAEWAVIDKYIIENLAYPSSELAKPPGERQPAKLQKDVNILVPGCGSSQLSERLYDAGFRSIMNVDFSKVVIMNMLRRNVRERPEMKWRCMDMTKLEFNDESFDAVVDKGGLDALMEPKIGAGPGDLYLSEVKRVLNDGGKFICLTLAESHVLDLLLPKFRFGWKMSLNAVGPEPPSQPLKLQTFMFVAEKDSTSAVSDILSYLGEYSVENNQVRILNEALEKERNIRTKYSTNSDLAYSIEDLKLGAKGNIAVLQPGRRIKLILGEPGVSNFLYNAILFDAEEDSERFTYQYGVFLVPQSRAHDWLYTSKQGLELIVSSSKSARLCVVFLDSSNSIYSMDSIQMDLSPLVKQLAPGYDDNLQIPYLAAGDGIKQRDIVHRVISDLTGPIIVEDVIYEDIQNDDPYKGHKYRRLTFERTENLVQSEALLSTKSDSRSSSSPATSSVETEIIHNYLASPYHYGIISGILFITSHKKVKTVVLGLGAGLLPMFMKENLPTLEIEVVELDPVVADVAKKCFGFKVDERLKVRITDGIQFVKEIAYSTTEEQNSCKVDILIVDVDSSDTSSGLTCPEAGFVDESFLLAAKESLSEQGLFIINLVSRSSSVKDTVYSRLKKIFSNIFRLNIEEDVNEVLFALKTDSPINEEQFRKASDIVAEFPEETQKLWSIKAQDLAKSIERLS